MVRVCVGSCAMTTSQSSTASIAETAIANHRLENSFSNRPMGFAWEDAFEGALFVLFFMLSPPERAFFLFDGRRDHVTLQQVEQILPVQPADEHAVFGQRDDAGLLAHNHDNRVGILAHAKGRAVARTHVLADLQVV